MIERLRWYRQFKGGHWCKVYFPCHYLHSSYIKWLPNNHPDIKYGQIKCGEIYGPIEPSPILEWTISIIAIVFGVTTISIILFLLGVFQ